VLEPQGTLFFLVLILAFAGLVTWLALTKQVVVRVLAAMLAFLPAAVFGIAVVNRYYDYYQTWGSLWSDVTGSGGQSVPQLAQGNGPVRGSALAPAITAAAKGGLSAQTGYLFRTTVTGRASHLTRQVYVYLPPQYFQPAYKTYRFPAIELLHGSPGEPSSWINVMDVIPIYLKLLADGRAKPAVLVMPDTNGNGHYSLQCLNIPPHGPMDMTFIGTEVPDWASRSLRVMPPGPAWGIAGYSEGGYCTANIALQDARRFGYAGILSGYFAPSNSHVPIGGRPGAPPVNVNNVFAHYPKLAAANTPYKYIQQFPIGEQVPALWLAVGGSDRADLEAAQAFRQYAMLRLTDVPLYVVKGGGHQAAVWRAALGPMLEWMTPQLNWADRQVQMIAAHNRAVAAANARKHPPKPRPATPALTANSPSPTALSRHA
jgi:enterochelin esterase-like enzyme